jgi:hypothetical protein
MRAEIRRAVAALTSTTIVTDDFPDGATGWVSESISV